MKYKNKTDERLRDRLEKTVSTDKIVSSNKMKKSRSSSRAASFNIGKIVNKTSEYDKTMEKAEDKVNPDVEVKKEMKVIQPVVKIFNKGNITYIKYKNNDIMVSQLPKLAKTDADIKALIDSINVKKAAMNDTGSFNSFLLKQYS
ncbi:MAG: hypothetical protein DRJ01_00680 [Bacteroidetes bacterium]|nr:MAG: hypothetical protein DRJ01_00680 [Bacteroidota bacterium]